ncbi:MAG: extracellular solute-binding protein [Oscillospiraceae bacterium]|jgi:ABC-type glycerol-3-phosphate transport system substrate-binding protein|nr:extracellular solute-binding protein [Oscillospiraceae bacterium]
MKNNKKSKLFPIVFISTTILLVAVIVFVGLRNNEDGNSDNPDHLSNGNQSNTNGHAYIYDEYVFLAGDRIMNLDTGNAVVIDGLIAKGELLYYIYIDYIDNPNTQDNVNDDSTFDPYLAVIEVKSINKSGEITKSIKIPTNRSFGSTTILGFDINDMEELIIITNESGETRGKNYVFYNKYDFTGSLIKRELLLEGSDWFAREAHISKNGNIAVVRLNFQHEISVRLLDEELSFIRSEALGFGAFTFSDEGMCLSLIEDNPVKIRKSDFLTGEQILEFPLEFHVSDIHKADESSAFDYYFITTDYIFGLCFETGKTEKILNFLESGIIRTSSNYFAFFDDGSIAVSRERMNNQTNLFHVELTILNPVHRSEIEESDEIVLAGFNFVGGFIEEVLDYNLRNPDQQITLRDYYDWSIVDYNELRRKAEERFHLDLISGNAPDFIYISPLWGIDLIELRDSLAGQGYLTDLYPLIDSDPLFKREDFFPRILKGYEDKSGRLLHIGNRLEISTMIYTAPVLQTVYWTIDSFLSLMENNVKNGIIAPLDTDLTGIHFLMTLLDLLSSEFIDYDTGKCTFDNEMFIRLLELTATIPDIVDIYEHTLYNPSLHRMWNGEQTVDLVFLYLLGGWVVEALHGETGVNPNNSYRYIGLPSNIGSSHNARIVHTYSIFEHSKHKDAAWNFIRESFLLDFELESVWGGLLTLHIDTFEKNLTSTNISNQAKDMFRNIVNKATVQKPLSNTIKMIVEEEVDAFLRGHRSAADVARIIQSRVSIYLSERS